MAEDAAGDGDQPTLLRELLQQRYWLPYRRFCQEYDRVARRLDKGLVGTGPSPTTYKRWLRGDIIRLPRWEPCAVLDAMFPEHRVEDLIQRANCWLTAGKPNKAVTLYEESIATLPVVYERSRSAALSRLAVAYVAIGEIERAASAAHAALPVARSGGSMRILDEVEGISRELGPHRKLESVASLLDDLDSDRER